MMLVRLPSVNVTVLLPGVLEGTRTIRLTKIIQKANVSKRMMTSSHFTTHVNGFIF